MLRLMYLAAVVPKDARLDPGVMPPERVLEMATIHGARALGLEGEIGSVEAGKRAGLVIFHLDTPEGRPLLHPVSHLPYSAARAAGAPSAPRAAGPGGPRGPGAGRAPPPPPRAPPPAGPAALTRAEDLAGSYLARAGLAPRPKWPLIT